VKKTRKVLSGISGAALLVGMAGCGASNSLPAQPSNSQCGEWEWEYDDGVWECEDSSSRYYNQYYHGGTYYPSRANLKNSSSYKSYRNSSSFKGSSSTSSSGFGSGSKSSSFGG
jgi:hypothetical protein